MLPESVLAVAREGENSRYARVAVVQKKVNFEAARGVTNENMGQGGYPRAYSRSKGTGVMADMRASPFRRIRGPQLKT